MEGGRLGGGSKTVPRSRCAPLVRVGPWRDGGSGRAAFVSVMKTTDLRNRHDSAVAGRRDRTRNRRVFVQRQVRTGPFVVRTIEGHQPLQARLVEDDHVIETLATSGSNESLNKCILPGRPAVP